MLSKKIVVAFFALLALSGCHHKKKPVAPQELIPAIDECSLSSEFERNVGDRVFFDFNKSNLSDKAKEQLKKQSDWLQKHCQVKATIEGHCDDRGTREYNLALGERRAEAVLKYLQQLGIDKSRLDTTSYGKERPAVIGDDKAAWAQNRRAVTVIK